MVSEDEVLDAVGRWAYYNEAESIEELLENVNWPYVSMRAMLEVLRKYPILRKNTVLKRMLNEEMLTRVKGDDRLDLTPPRYHYKHNAVCFRRERNLKEFTEELVDFFFADASSFNFPARGSLQ